MEQQIESILFYKNEPVPLKDLSAWLEVSEETALSGLSALKESLASRGITLLENRGKYSLVTNPNNSSLIEKIIKEYGKMYLKVS